MGARTFAAMVVLLSCAGAAHAQPSVSLQFANGRVTLRAQNAPVRTILAEWARLGGATIVNGERVTGQPVTLELTGVPERQALDIVLRNVAGYMLAPRQASSTGASSFDRILILPTSVAPRNPPPGPVAAAGARPGLQRPAVLARPPEATLVETPPDGNQVDEPPDEPEPRVSPPPPPGGPPPLPGDPRVTPRLLPRPPVPQGADTSQDEAGAGEVTVVGAPGTSPTPGNPFGIPAGSSATPGVIAPVPQPQQRQQPNPPNRVQ